MSDVMSSWSGVIGQDLAVERLHQLAIDPVHAYLFVGPAGCTKEIAARSFAGLLLSGTDDSDNNDVRMALNGFHPDIIEVRREGASISRDQADEIIRTAALSPLQSKCKVIIVEDFHLARPDTTARLLKTIEEPPVNTYFILLADQMDDSLITIASRCVRVEFRELETQELETELIAAGIDSETAKFASESASGDLRRAKLLATDSGLRQRREAFANVPRRLDGTGHMVTKLVSDLMSMINDAALPMEERQSKELEELERQLAEYGARGGKKNLVDEHKRQLRRHRADELKAGLSTIAGTYRDAIVSAPHASINNDYIQAIHAIHKSIRVIDLNVNEPLLLQALFLKIPRILEN